MVEESSVSPLLVIEVEELGVPPLLVTAAAVEEGRVTVETAFSQAVSKPPAEARSGGADVVMVPSDEDSAPPPPAGDSDIMMSAAPEASPAMGVALVEEVMDMAAWRYVDFVNIGTIDLDAPELLGNDRELLQVATKWIFAELTILETIATVASALRQYESVGGTTPPPRRRRRREFLRNPRPAWSQSRLRPHLRQPERTRSRRCPSPQN
jgi:hypothetical protein